VAALAPHGIDVDEEFYRARISGRGNEIILKDLLPNLSAEEAREISERKEVAFREELDGLEPIPGLLDFVEMGKEANLAIALVTNAPRDNVSAVLAALALAEDFDELVLSEDIGVAKPDPAPYRAAVERLGIDPERALAFEDSVSGVASAVGAGVPTVGIATTQEPELLKRAGAFMVVRNFDDPELRKLVRSSTG
jgi:HAD superfamily hydrolase (TIGR01509 family)